MIKDIFEISILLRYISLSLYGTLRYDIYFVTLRFKFKFSIW